MDKIEGPVNRQNLKKKPFYRIVLELILFFWFVGIFWYIARNIVPLIPFPFDGIFGYDHFKVKELHSATLFATMLLLMSKNYKIKTDYLYYNM
jgi:type IV secretory pathway TrbL component